MKRPTILYNVVIAVIMTMIAIFAGFVLQHVFYKATVTPVLISLLTIIFIFHLLVKSDVRVGKITLALTCLIALGILLFVKSSLSHTVLFSAGLIWGARSILNYSSLLSVIADLSLCVVSLVSALWGLIISDSIAVAIWCFFLTQALSALIPVDLKHQSRSETKADQDRFILAYQTAEAAIRQLALR